MHAIISLEYVPLSVSRPFCLSLRCSCPGVRAQGHFPVSFHLLFTSGLVPSGLQPFLALCLPMFLTPRPFSPPCPCIDFPSSRLLIMSSPPLFLYLSVISPTLLPLLLTIQWFRLPSFASPSVLLLSAPCGRSALPLLPLASSPSSSCSRRVINSHNLILL